MRNIYVKNAQYVHTIYAHVLLHIFIFVCLVERENTKTNNSFDRPLFYTFLLGTFNEWAVFLEIDIFAIRHLRTKKNVLLF